MLVWHPLLNGLYLRKGWRKREKERERGREGRKKERFIQKNRYHGYHC